MFWQYHESLKSTTTVNLDLWKVNFAQVKLFWTDELASILTYEGEKQRYTIDF